LRLQQEASIDQRPEHGIAQHLVEAEEALRLGEREREAGHFHELAGSVERGVKYDFFDSRHLLFRKPNVCARCGVFDVGG
jgi:hypothetical protein